MSNNEIYTFYPHFKEFLPLFRDVTSVWIGDGENTGELGMLYASYANEQVSKIGSVSLYGIAVDNGYEGSEQEWMQGIIHLAALYKGATSVVTYQNSDNGSTAPTGTWTNNPSPVKGMYLWAKNELTWPDQSKSNVYTVSYIPRDGAGNVETVNGQEGNVVLHGANIPISGTDNQTIKDYTDDIVTDLHDYVEDAIGAIETATTEEINALFTT